jgi:hypothetical protein
VPRSRRVARAAPRTGWPVVFLLLLIASATTARAEDEFLGTLTVPPPDAPGPRKLLIVHGVALSGTLEARYDKGGATLGGVPYLAAPRPTGFMVPRVTPDASNLSPAARIHFGQLPRVARHLREGWSADAAIVDYWTASESLLVRVSRAYRMALPGGEAQATRAARSAIDPELAYPDSTGPRAGSFSANGSISLYFVNDFARSISVIDAPSPTPEQQAAWLRDRAKGQLSQFRTMFALDGPVLVVCTEGAIMTSTGASATEVFAEIDQLKAAGTKQEREILARTIVHLPRGALRDMEDAGFFDTRPDKLR